MADHKHPIIDADPHFSIDITNRTITNSKSKKVSLIQYDHNSERFSFDIDREIEGHDIMDCNRIQIHYINTSASTRTKHIGLYEVTDKQVHPDNDKKVCFTWLISDNATHYEGMLSFLIAFECVDGEEILYRWNSGICNAISIVAGINNNNAVSEVYVDELLKWENYIVDHFDELETELVSTTIPAIVDECYVNREFATSEEVAAIFALEAGDVLTITVAEVVQGTGQSETAVMSQKATTDALDGKVNKQYFEANAFNQKRKVLVPADGKVVSKNELMNLSTGLYWMSVSYKLYDFPTSNDWIILLVYGGSSHTSYIVYTSDNLIYIANILTDTDRTWVPWKRIASTSDITTATAVLIDNSLLGG